MKVSYCSIVSEMHKTMIIILLKGLLVGPAKDLKTGSVMDILKKDSHRSNISDSSQSS